MSQREFRTKESYQAEHTTRNMVSEFLRSRGFCDVRDEQRKIGAATSQTIQATAPDGARLSMRVKLCWRRTDNSHRFAAQLQAEKVGDWEESVQRFVEHAQREGVTHFLLVQREGDNGNRITAAALIPADELVAIWCDQRDVSKLLIAQGKLGRRKKNHAENGKSPTLWLEDDAAQEVTEALWKHTGVQNLADFRVRGVAEADPATDDSFDDLPGFDYALLGSDGGARTVSLRSHVKRDSRVRRVVLNRSNGKCEREECGASRSYQGFLDVHHILGADKSDRVWNCVALCPNCHREAHTAPNGDEINSALLHFATQFR